MEKLTLKDKYTLKDKVTFVKHPDGTFCIRVKIKYEGETGTTTVLDFDLKDKRKLTTFLNTTE